MAVLKNSISVSDYKFTGMYFLCLNFITQVVANAVIYVHMYLIVRGVYFKKIEAINSSDYSNTNIYYFVNCINYN